MGVGGAKRGCGRCNEGMGKKVLKKYPPIPPCPFLMDRFME
jgi:hypothetical protein